VGDHIFTIAQLALTELGPVEPRLTVQAIRELNRTCVLLVEGQYIDLALANAAECSLNDYFAMIERKTAALIACACRLGALCAGGSEADQTSFGAFGRELGIAFQLQDDILGVWGTDAVGKPADADILERKKAIPAVLALTKHGAESEQLRELYAGTHPLSAAEVEEVRDLLTQLAVRETADTLAQEHHNLALEALEATSARGEPRELLVALCQSLLKRDA
jgi:geranylgeranyl diphosphate synthase type I